MYQQLHDTLPFLESTEVYDIFDAMETGVELKSRTKNHKISKKLEFFIQTNQFNFLGSSTQFSQIINVTYTYHNVI